MGGDMILCSRVRSEGEEEEEEGVVWSKSPLRTTLINHILAYNILSRLDVNSIENLTKAYPELKAKHRVEEFKFLLRRLIRNSHNTKRIRQLFTLHQPELVVSYGKVGLKQIYTRSNHYFAQNAVRLLFDYINSMISYHIGAEVNEMFPCCRRASNPAEDISPLLEEYMQRVDDENCPLIANGGHCWSSQDFFSFKFFVEGRIVTDKISELTVEQHTFRLFIVSLLENRLSDGKINKTLKPLVDKTDGSCTEENEEEEGVRNSPTATISLSNLYCSTISLNVRVSPPFWETGLCRDWTKIEFEICVPVIHEGPTSQLTDSLMEMLNSKYQPAAVTTVRPSLAHPRVEVSYDSGFLKIYWTKNQRIWLASCIWTRYIEDFILLHHVLPMQEDES